MTSLDEIKNRIRESLLETASFESGFSNIKSFDHGATRVVGIIQSGPYEGKVVKFPSHKRHIKTNLKELKIWNTYRGTDKEKYFVPVKYHECGDSWHPCLVLHQRQSTDFNSPRTRTKSRT
jgi:hypothetical protein